MMAYELRAKIDAGLQMCGQDADGELEWIGRKEQFRDAEAREFDLIWGLGDYQRIPF